MFLQNFSNKKKTTLLTTTEDLDKAVFFPPYCLIFTWIKSFSSWLRRHWPNISTKRIPSQLLAACWWVGIDISLSQRLTKCTLCSINDWLLSTNPKKTEVITFQNKCRTSTLNKYCFQINHHKIEIVHNYTYLGVNISSKRSFVDWKSNFND